jgi:hypothetical protein
MYVTPLYPLRMYIWRGGGGESLANFRVAKMSIGAKKKIIYPQAAYALKI